MMEERAGPPSDHQDSSAYREKEKKPCLSAADSYRRENATGHLQVFRASLHVLAHTLRSPRTHGLFRTVLSLAHHPAPGKHVYDLGWPRMHLTAKPQERSTACMWTGQPCTVRLAWGALIPLHPYLLSGEKAWGIRRQSKEENVLEAQVCSPGAPRGSRLFFANDFITPLYISWICSSKLD